MKQWILAGALALAGASGLAVAQEADEGGMTMEQFVEQLEFKSGTVKIAAADATLEVGEGFHYLGAGDAQRVLEEAWGNPPDDTVLGMLVPDDADLTSEHSWAVVVTYVDDGYVSDEDAREIDYAEVLETMQAEIEDTNEAREAEGYPKLHLRGWAQPPTYDAVGKRLHWAKDVAFEGEDSNTLNYDIRVLGRGGYLSLNAVASMDDFALVKKGMADVLPMAKFDAGHAYADYQDGDKTAAYGLAALVAGGVAAKAGFFGKLGVLLLSLKKFLIVIVIALAAGAKKIFGLFKKKDAGTVS
jgi:uncharacterized membrane-anchored protein